MGVRANKTGLVYGQLSVLGRVPSGCPGDSYYVCQCECGKRRVIPSYRLRPYETVSCGLHRTPHNGVPRREDGDRTSEYTIWVSMKSRCNPDTVRSEWHGKRGITVCDRWLSFSNFLSDMGPRPSKKHSLDRINNDGDYCPENCRWATNSEQMHNRRDNVYLELHGDRKQLSEWVELTGLNRETIRTRLRKGWSEEAALTTPVYGRTEWPVVPTSWLS